MEANTPISKVEEDFGACTNGGLIKSDDEVLVACRVEFQF